MLASVYKAKGQTSVLQDKSGETSFSVLDQPVVINAAAANITANVNRGMAKNGKTRFIGASFTLKADEGVAALLDGYRFKPDYKASVYYQRSLSSVSNSDFKDIYFSASYSRSYFNLLNNNNTNTFDARTYGGFQGKAGYNMVTVLGKTPLVLGLAADFGVRNNLDDLKPVLVYTTQTVNQLIQLSDKKAGYRGNYESTYQLRLYLDSYIYPQQIMGGRTGFGGYIRTQVNGSNPKTNAGVGFVLGQQDAPAKVVVGAFYQFGDIFNQLGSDDNLIKRSGVNVVAGYLFGK